jgi:hypothetical protein
MADVRIVTHRLDPMEAELRILADGEVTGRVLGPRNLYASTIEVAYYVQPPRRTDAVAGRRVLIPEPSLWEPETPHLYEALLLVDGRKLSLRHGLRHIDHTPQGVRLNRKPFAIRAHQVERCDERQLQSLRASDINTVVCAVTLENAHLWDLADRIGLFVVGVLGQDPQCLALAQRLQAHASSLGWQETWGSPGETPALSFLDA